jgi:two-component system, OmpR family, heavy metal sensor histidine kinase CusS
MLRRLSFSHLSLTSRLSLFFTLVATSVVLGLSALFVTATDRYFIDLDRGLLKDKQHLIDAILVSANSAENLRWRVSESLNHHHGLFVQVSTQTGQQLFQTDGFPATDRWLFSDHEMLLHYLTGEQSGRRQFRVLQFRAHAQYAPETPLEITLATDTAHHQQFLDNLVRTLAMYALAAILTSGLLGWMAVYLGLAPLRAIKAHAAAMTAQRLQACMPVQSVPAEMADLAQTLNKMLERLEEDFRRLSEFSSNLAHELRTPISNLLTQTQVTLAARRDNAYYRDILASNAEELQRLARMVADMLLLAKTERGVDLPHKEGFMVADECQALIDFYEAVADDKKIKLTLQGNGSIEGDRLMFRRALSNLLSNALRHVPQGGAVGVIVSESAQFTEITVENTGKDIDPQALPRLFDRFYRADPARSHPTSDGAGLGLAITKAIVEAHGGTASVRSEHGKTDFTLRFPRRDQ